MFIVLYKNDFFINLLFSSHDSYDITEPSFINSQENMKKNITWKWRVITFFIFHPSCNITFDMSPPSTPVSLPGSRQIHTLRYKYSHVYYYTQQTSSQWATSGKQTLACHLCLSSGPRVENVAQAIHQCFISG